MRARQLASRQILHDMPNPWGRAIEALRLQHQNAPGARKRDWTQAAVARRAKMTATTYGKIEKGGHTLTSQLRDIADVFGVPIEAVLMPAAENPQLAPAQQKALFLEFFREQFSKPTAEMHAMERAAMEATLRDGARREAEAIKRAEEAEAKLRRKNNGRRNK